MSEPKTWRVSFCVHDWYSAEITADTADAAIAKAQDLYDADGEAPFAFDLERGGTHDWDAEPVPPVSDSDRLCNEAIEILRATHDGDDLPPEDLRLVEQAVNGQLDAAGREAFAALLARVRSACAPAVPS